MVERASLRLPAVDVHGQGSGGGGGGGSPLEHEADVVPATVGERDSTELIVDRQAGSVGEVDPDAYVVAELDAISTRGIRFVANLGD